MTDSDKTKTIDGFAYWIENEENGVCYIPLNLCEKIMKLLKEQKAMVKPTKCPCGELFDAKDSSFCPRCGCAYGELSGRYTNVGR